MTKKRIKVLIVDDEDAFRTGLCKRLSRRGFETFEAESGEKAVSIAARHLLDIALVDIRMPGMDGIKLLPVLKDIHPSIEVIILTGVATVDTAIAAMKLGAYDYLSKPCRFEELTILIERAHEKKLLHEQNVLMTRRLQRLDHADFVGKSDKAKDIRKFIRAAARADCSVLIEGESGTGKELIAREIHRQSPRADQPFVVLDCGAFPEALLADELFGHKKGAFTTAIDSRQGLLEFVDGGTLLIDEIGEMTSANQVGLLRVVETKTFRRIGESKELSVNVRIIASTNRNLRREVDRGNFREDLFFRLEIMHYIVPPLRERKDDIPLLSEHFLQLLNQAKGTSKTILPNQMEMLSRNDWPGNIRELANLIERGFYLTGGDTISLADFLKLSAGRVHESNKYNVGADHTLSDIEREHILGVLASTKWNKKKAALVLDISRSRLYNLIKKHKIPMSPTA